MNGMDMQEALDQAGVLPDVDAAPDLPLLWIHRQLNNTDIYFLTNQGDHQLRMQTGFRVKDRKPELWDAVSGKKRDLPSYEQDGEITRVAIELEPYESAFVVFARTGKPDPDNKILNYPEPRVLVEMNAPWEVSFDAAMRGPEETVTMQDLLDWSASPNAQIRYYSGTAVYKNTFKMDEIPSGETIYLNLGRVGIMAEVKVNGQPAGGVWTAPWRVDITGLVKAGENTLEVEVVNNWINRLIGDSRLPVKDRKTWINVNVIRPSDPLQSSGLIGPVSIVAVKY